MRKDKIMIRPVKNGDFVAITNMIKEMSEFHEKLYDMAKFEKMENQCKLTTGQIKRDFKDNLFRCLVVEATHDKKTTIIGYALYYFIYSTWNGKCMYLEDIYVKNDYQKMGIGTELLRKVAQDALDTKCAIMRLACLEWNTVALNLYKKLGADDLTDKEAWHMVAFDHNALTKLAS